MTLCRKRKCWAAGRCLGHECSEDGCEREEYSGGLCKPAYTRRLAEGKKVAQPPKPIIVKLPIEPYHPPCATDGCDDPRTAGTPYCGACLRERISPKLKVGSSLFARMGWD